MRPRVVGLRRRRPVFLSLFIYLFFCRVLGTHLIVYDSERARARSRSNTIKIRTLQQKAFPQDGVTDCTRRKWSRSPSEKRVHNYQQTVVSSARRR